MTEYVDRRAVELYARQMRSRETARLIRKGFSSLFGGIAATLREMAEQARIRRELALMSDRDLRDLGIARCDIPAIAGGTFRRDGATVAAKPAIRAPQVPVAANDAGPDRLAA